MPQCDKIIMLDSGSIVDIGSYDELKNKKGSFLDFMNIYLKLIEDKKSRKESCSKENYIFLPTYDNRDTAMAIIARQFRKVLERTGLGEGTGKNLTLYSLRHTSIMLRLQKGNVDTLVLARNARTSQQMIDKFYAQHLTTDQVRRQLHAFLPEGRGGRT